tara:strand:+ start:337 stop:1074 length:738 start_codon:yes stop_codon:yes gene_type:complete
MLVGYFATVFAIGGNMTNKSRRNLLKSLGVASVGVLGSRALADLCVAPTPQQTEGPFYPEQDQRDKDNDLTMVKNRSGVAKGERIILHGKVVDVSGCEPISGALVEIWQACHSGRYNHSADPNTAAELDPNFQYWGQAITNDNGEYEFTTIRPGQYPAAPGWVRPAHIHMKVHKRGYKELTTQMYFADDELNEQDAIYMAMSPAERSSVTVAFNVEPCNHAFCGDGDLWVPKKGFLQLSLDKIVR